MNTATRAQTTAITLVHAYDVRRWDHVTLEVTAEEYEQLREAEDQDLTPELLALITSRGHDISGRYDEDPDYGYNATIFDVELEPPSAPGTGPVDETAYGLICEVIDRAKSNDRPLDTDEYAGLITGILDGTVTEIPTEHESEDDPS